MCFVSQMESKNKRNQVKNLEENEKTLLREKNWFNKNWTSNINRGFLFELLKRNVFEMIG